MLRIDELLEPCIPDRLFLAEKTRDRHSGRSTKYSDNELHACHLCFLSWWSCLGHLMRANIFPVGFRAIVVQPHARQAAKRAFLEAHETPKAKSGD